MFYASVINWKRLAGSFRDAIRTISQVPTTNSLTEKVISPSMQIIDTDRE